MTSNKQGAALAADKVALGLGWFSLGLGLAEVLMPRAVARAAGIAGLEGMVKTCGVREIVNGIGLLTARHKAPWMWARVAGDALDLVTLGAGASSRNVGVSMAVMAAVAAADAACARALSRQQKATAQPERDYSDRSGLPQSPSQMRGAARADFETPQDMQLPSALRPYTLH